MQFGSLTLKQCKYGWMLYAGPYIGTCFDRYGQYSESEVEVMRNFLTEGSVAIDVGANIGDLTLPLARIVGPTGRVIAVESHPVTFNILCANLALNAVSNVRPLNIYLAPDGAGATNSGTWGQEAYVGDYWPPSFAALDSLDIPQCDLIKIDVDGAELAVLESGEMIIEKHRPVLYFENDQEERSASLLEFAMHQLGYDLYWHPAPIFDPDNIAGDPVNHWAPDNIVSRMVLGVPREQERRVALLKKITRADEWWDSVGR